MIAEAVLERLAVLVKLFPERRLGSCPYCEVTPVWRNAQEYTEHVLGCVRITNGVKVLA